MSLHWLFVGISKTQIHTYTTPTHTWYYTKWLVATFEHIVNLAECFLYTTYVNDDDALMIIIILMMHIFRKSLYSLIWIFILEFLIIFQEFTFFVFTTCDKLDFDYVIAPEHGCRCSALFFFTSSFSLLAWFLLLLFPYI